MQKIFEKTRILKHAELIKHACIEEHGSRMIIPTRNIMENVSLKELGNYIAIKYVNKFRTEKIAVRNQKGNYVSDQKYKNPKIQERLAHVKKSIGKINQRIPIVYRFVDNKVEAFDDNNFAFHMILFCVWWKADNDEGIDKYYEGIKEVFDIVNTQFPDEPRLEFNYIASARASARASPSSSPSSSSRSSLSSSPSPSARASPSSSARSSASSSASSSPRSSPISDSNSANKSFEQLVMDITRVGFKIYNQEYSRNFCEGLSEKQYPDCGESTARNIINILCYDGDKFDTRLLIEKGAIDELLEYYRVFTNFELQSQTNSIYEIYGMKLNARDAWSKLINTKSQTLIRFSKSCDKPKYGFDMMSGLTLDEENPKPNLLQMLNNLMTNVKTWKDLENESTIEKIEAKVDEDGIGVIQINAAYTKFMVYLNRGHYYVDLPKEEIDKIKYDHITDEKQKAIFDILLKTKITEQNFIEINFSSELFEKTFQKFSEKFNANALYCLFQLSTTDKFDDDLRRRMKIDVNLRYFFEKFVKDYKNNPIINKYVLIQMWSTNQVLGLCRIFLL